MNFNSHKLSALHKAQYCFFVFFILVAQLLSGQARVVVNPGLEFGVADGTAVFHDTNFGQGNTFDAGSGITSPWYTSHPQQSGECAPGFAGNCHPIEVWGTTFNNVTAAQGRNFVELNAFESSMIYQNMYLTTGDQITYYFRHRARSQTTERAAMMITNADGSSPVTVHETAAASSISAWSVNSGNYIFNGTSGIYRVGFMATVAGSSAGSGNFLDDIRITLNPLIDLKFSIALPSCEGNSNGLLFLRINGAVAANTVVAVQLVNPQNGTAFISDGDITVTAVSNSQGTPTVSHTAGSQYYMITIPPGNYDGGSVAGYSSPNNDEDGVALSIASVNDGVVEPDENFRFQITPAGTNGSTTNFKSDSSPIFGDTYYPTTNNYIIQECACYSPANISVLGSDTKHGITTLNRAGGDSSNWPMVRKSGHTVLESNTKGFVVNRLTTMQVNAIVSPQEGMMVYDTDANCLKLYDGTAWSCFNTATCP